MLALGRGLGRLRYSLCGSDRRVALANLDLAYGDRVSARSKRRIARRSFEDRGQVLLERFGSSRLDERTLGRIVTISAEDRARPAELVAKTEPKYGLSGWLKSSRMYELIDL
jgi:lauroyl/myristoyl acyltransferase